MHNALSHSIRFHPSVMRGLYWKALWGLPAQLAASLSLGKRKKKLRKETTQTHAVRDGRGSESSLINTGSAHTSKSQPE